jgi:tripartite-type tricarboxylate transporter receptor subunit TctC
MLARIRFFAAVVGVILGSVLGGGGSTTLAAPFFEGKQLVVVVAYRPGGAGHLRTQIEAQHLSKLLPGHPTVVYKFVPGADGAAAANYMSNVARRDGLTIANIGTGMFSSAIFKAPEARFKLKDFIFFGTGYGGGPYVVEIRPELGLDTIEKLKAYKGVRFGQRTVGHPQYILDRLIAYVLELKDPKFLVGFSSQDIITALKRGEADAHTQNLYSFLWRDGLNKLKKGYTVPIVVRNTNGRGMEWVPEFPRRPYLDDFADTELKRAVIRFHNSSKPGSTNFLAPKGIPVAALNALQEGFQKLWMDPEFAIEYRYLTGQPSDPVTGEEIHNAIKQLPKDPKIARVYKQITEGGPLPPVR